VGKGRRGTGDRSAQTLKECRRFAVQARLTGGSLSDAERASGLSRHAVIRADRAYKNGGWDAVDALPSGRPPGSGHLLNIQQEAQLRDWVHSVSPRELGLPQLLWSKRAVKQLIQERFGRALAGTTLASYLERWGLGLKHPFESILWTDYKGYAEAWRSEVYPGDAKRLNRIGIELLWCDWQSVAASPLRDPTVSETSQSATAQKRKRKRIVLYAMTTRRVARWLCYDRLNSASIIDFLGALNGSSRRPLGLFLVGSRIPIKSDVLVWLRTQRRVRRVRLDKEGLEQAYKKFEKRSSPPAPPRTSEDWPTWGLKWEGW
jgi:transposase